MEEKEGNKIRKDVEKQLVLEDRQQKKTERAPRRSKRTNGKLDEIK